MGFVNVVVQIPKKSMGLLLISVLLFFLPRLLILLLPMHLEPVPMATTSIQHSLKSDYSNDIIINYYNNNNHHHAKLGLIS